MLQSYGNIKLTSIRITDENGEIKGHEDKNLKETKDFVLGYGDWNWIWEFWDGKDIHSLTKASICQCSKGN